MDCGGTWRNMVKCGGTWWSVLDRCGQCMKLWRPLESKYSLCTYADKFIVYFFHMVVVYWKTGLIQVNQLGVKRLTNPSQQFSCDSIQTWKIAIIV